MSYTLRSFVTFVPLLAAFISDGTSASVRILVHGEHQANTIVYRYTVINNSGHTFNTIVIGSRYDAAIGDTWPELGKLPIGTRFGREGEVGTETLIDPSSTTQPAGWESSIYGAQDSGFYYLGWHGNGRAISPGQTLSGFSVTVPRGRDPLLGRMPVGSDLKYLNGNFSIGLPSGADLHGVLERQDTTPPVLNATANPVALLPTNNKLVPITVSVSVKDDYDPMPEVKLESIAANETLESDDIGDALLGTFDTQFKLAAKRSGTNQQGRVYTITYSATDASGNKSVNVVRVTVAHDQAK